MVQLLNKEQVISAAQAILLYHQKKKGQKTKPELLEDEDTIYILISLKKVPHYLGKGRGTGLKPYRM